MIHGNASKYTKAWDHLHQYCSIINMKLFRYSFCVRSHCCSYRYIHQIALIINNSLSLWSSQQLGTIQAVSHCHSWSKFHLRPVHVGFEVAAVAFGSFLAVYSSVHQSVSLYLHSTVIHSLPVLYNLSN